MRRHIATLAMGGALGIVGIFGIAGVANARPAPAPPQLATIKGSNVGCVVTWTGHSVGQIGSYEAFTFTSTPPSTPAQVGGTHPTAATGVHPGGSATSVEVLAPGTTSATLTFHVVNNYGQQQTTPLTITTAGC